MTIIPAIDLINGKVVRLEQGDFNRQTNFDENATDLAMRYQDAGAVCLHIVDLDGAKRGEPAQTNFIRDIASRTSMQVQVGGGVRSAQHVETLLEAGVERVVVGSIAAKSPELFSQWVEQFGPERFVVSPDCKLVDGRYTVMSHGWQENASLELTDLLQRVSDWKVRDVLITDIAQDGMMQGPNFSLYEMVLDKFNHLRVQASGGIDGLSSLQRLASLGVDGAILGKSLLTGAFEIKEALACSANA